MAELIGEERVAAHCAGARWGTDQDLAHRRLIDPERRERIAGDAFVVLDLERVCRWGERTDDRGDCGDHYGGRESSVWAGGTRTSTTPFEAWQVPVDAPHSILSVLAHAGLRNWRIVTNCDESTVGAAGPMCLGVDDVFRVQHLGVTQLLRDPEPVDKRLGVGPQIAAAFVDSAGDGLGALGGQEAVLHEPRRGPPRSRTARTDRRPC